MSTSNRPRKSYLDAKHAPDRRPQGHQLVRDVTDGELEDWDAYGIEYETIRCPLVPEAEPTE